MRMLLLSLGFILACLGLYAQDIEQYHNNTASALAKARRELSTPISDKTAGRIAAEIPRLVIGACQPPTGDTLATGDWRRGVITLCDNNGDGVADTMGFYFPRPDTPFSELVSLGNKENALVATDHLGNLYVFTDRQGKGIADQDPVEYTGLGQADALLVPAPGSFWIGNPGNPRVLQYKEDAGRISIPVARNLPLLGGGSIAFSHNSRGDLFSIDLRSNAIWWVPNSLAGLRWDLAKPLLNLLRAVALAIDDQDNIFVVQAQGFVQPPPVPIPSGEVKPPQQFEPSRLLMFRQERDGSLGRPFVVAEGGALDVDYSAVNGVVARKGRVYVISNGPAEPGKGRGKQILLFDFNQQRLTTFLPSFLAGDNAFFSGLALLAQ